MQQPHRERPGTALRQPGGRHRRKGGELDFGEPENRVVSRDDDVAQQRDLGAAAERRAVDCRDGERFEVEQQPGVFADFSEHDIHPGGDMVRNIDPGREGARQGAAQHKHADRGGIALPQRAVELA